MVYVWWWVTGFQLYVVVGHWLTALGGGVFLAYSYMCCVSSLQLYVVVNFTLDLFVLVCF